MRPFLCAVAITTALAVVSACRVSRQPRTTPARNNQVAAATECDRISTPSVLGFPKYFDYPQSESSIHNWSNGHRQRLHAYCLFAGLNYPLVDSKPTWRTWETTSQLFYYQYNPWPTSSTGQAAEGMTEERTVPINIARSRAAGATGKIVNPAPTYYVNAAVANNPAYKNAGCLQPAMKAGQVLGYTLKDGKVFQSNGDIMIAAVSYSPIATRAIYGRVLYSAARLDGELPDAGSPARSMNPMPPDSIVLKVMLWPVSGTSPTALPVWDWDAEANKPGLSNDGQYAGYEMKSIWTNAVAITNGPAPSTVTFLHGVLDPTGARPLGPNTYQNPKAFDLSHFYFKTYSDNDLGALSPCDRAILDASAWWTYNRAFQAGDSLALIAMHIMTKEQSEWTFQSAWWHPDAGNCNNARFCQDQPTSVPGGDTTFKNYMMTTTYGQTQQPPSQAHKRNYYAPPDTKQPPNVWPVAYNPYIELAASHPITTNCMNCHHRAAWPPNTELFPNKTDQGRFSAYLQITSPNPNVLEKFDSSDPAFKGLLMLDSMWAISDRAGYPTNAQANAKSPQ